MNDSNLKKRLGRGILWLVVVVAVLLFLQVPLHRNRNIRYLPEMRGFFNGSAIGSAIANYSDEHNGQLPITLDQLVPSYIVKSNEYWIPSQRAIRGNYINNTNIDRHADPGVDFVYLGVPGLSKDILAYERTQSSRDGYTNVGIIRGDYSGGFIPMAELEKRLK